MGGGRYKRVRDFIDRLRNDRVEQVFGILTVGGVITFFGLYFFAPDEILGMSKGFILVLTILGIVGVRVALNVVRTFQHLDDLF